MHFRGYLPGRNCFIFLYVLVLKNELNLVVLQMKIATRNFREHGSVSGFFMSIFVAWLRIGSYIFIDLWVKIYGDRPVFNGKFSSAHGV